MPGCPKCLTAEKSKDLTPFKPTASDWITAVLEDVPPVIVSPATKVPLTLDNTKTPCITFPDEV